MDRFNKSIDNFLSKDDPATKGRVIPDEDQLLFGEGTHLDLAVLFLDISGFTSWPSSNADEQERVLVAYNIFMTEMIRICQDYDGTVEKNTGDGIMAYFAGTGASSRQDACERALACAMTMFKVSGRLVNPLLTENKRRTIDFRIGIDWGAVTIAKVGVKRQFVSNVAIGSTANIANRILKHAPANQIWIGESVKEALSPQWQAFCKLALAITGFVYVKTQKPYPYYHFDASWSENG